MELFDETNNIYYEMIIDLLKSNGEFDFKQFIAYLNEIGYDEKIYSLKDKCDETSLFKLEDNKYKLKDVNNTSLNPKSFPIILNKIERQAFKSIPDNSYASYFLDETLIKKIKNLSNDIDEEWNINDITIKNVQNKNKFIEHSNLKLIIDALLNNEAVSYTYRLKDGKILKQSNYPYKLEYSSFHDQINICFYSSKSDRFILSKLSKIKNVKLNNKLPKINDLDVRFKNQVHKKTKTVKLKLKSEDYSIDRAFRLFSHYSRKATYDEEKDVYTLEIKYLESEEKDIINNILSFDRSAIVLEPQDLREKVISEIKAIYSNY